MGKGHDALIKIEIGHFVNKIEKRININKYKGMKDESQDKDFKNTNDINHEFSSDTSTYLANIFKSKSILNIKLISLIFFLVFLLIIIIEFVSTILNVQTIKKNIVKMKKAYKLCEDIGFIKYMIMESVLCNTYYDDYIILIVYEMTLEEDIDYLKWESEIYSFEFRSIYEDFSSTSLSEFSEKYRNFVSSETEVLIYTISNGKEINQTIPYATAMNRIPTTIFFLSSIMDSSIELNMSERNTYELTFNLLNGYYMSIKELTLILAEDAHISSETSILSEIVFYSSFGFAIIFLIIIWKLLWKFFLERQKPINLFLTIKKQIFEDLKNASESFSNKLLNKLFGNEDNEEENQKDYQMNIKDSDINIIKFKAPNDYKTKNKHNKEQLRNYIKLVLYFILIEAYLIFKFIYANYYVDNVKKFLDVFNITYYSYVDIIINIDLSKQFIYNKSIPIFNHKHSDDIVDKESPFYEMFYEITSSFESMIISTSTTTSFLSGKYKDKFGLYLYQDFSEMVYVNTSYLPNPKLLYLIDKGFKPCVFNILEKLRFVWIEYYQGKPNTINDKRWCDIDFLVLYVIRPWYIEILELMHGESDLFLNGVNVVQISAFIVVVVIFLLSYFIVWKSYEESLELLLQRSFDLIKLIPEEIKYLIVTKLNE